MCNLFTKVTSQYRIFSSLLLEDFFTDMWNFMAIIPDSGCNCAYETYTVFSYDGVLMKKLC